MSRYFLNNCYYFITIPTVDHFPFFDTPRKKQVILDRIIKARDKFYLNDFDFSIISNHYHFISYFQHGGIIPQLLQLINGGSAYALNKLTNNKKPIWDEYNIYLINDEEVLAKVRGYVVGNPLKHGEVKTLEELGRYPFSSYATLIKKIDKDTIQECIRSVIVLEEDELINKLKLVNINRQPD